VVGALGVVEDQPVGQLTVKERKVGSTQAAGLCHQPGVGLGGFRCAGLRCQVSRVQKTVVFCTLQHPANSMPWRAQKCQDFR
jgi:hypothetical protein